MFYSEEELESGWLPIFYPNTNVRVYVSNILGVFFYVTDHPRENRSQVGFRNVNSDI